MSDEVAGISHEQKIRNARASGRLNEEELKFLDECEADLKVNKRLKSVKHVARLHDLWVKGIKE